MATKEIEMNHKIHTAVAVISGLAALVSISLPSVTAAAKPATEKGLASISLPSVTSAAKQPAAEKGPVAQTTVGGSFARSGAWTFEGKADLHDSGALELKVRTTAGVPRAFESVRRLLVGRDVLLVDTRVPVVDLNGRGVSRSWLDDAILRVKGTLLPPAQWRYDLDGEATPTVRASRIIVLGLD
jgi:hypothetical protein